MNYMSITTAEVANGEGVRVALWVAGCEHHCPGCHNAHAANPNAGKPFTRKEFDLVLNELSKPYVSGLTLTGGDPLYPDNLHSITSIVTAVKAIYPNKPIWLWTGYLWEQIKDLSLLQHIDVLVDGPYIETERDITLAWRGSRNQRVIDVQKSIESNSIVLYEKET